jgi:NAD(P)-dependent dehydrogenase (short-subunit alcohol dehydrogenase family)
LLRRETIGKYLKKSHKELDQKYFVMKTVLVAGSSSGIGLEIVKELLKTSRVYGCGRTPKTSDAIASLLREYPENYHYSQIDLSVPSQVSKLYEDCQKEFGKIDSMVYNAGILKPITSVAEVDMDAFKMLFQVNFFSLVQLCKLCIPSLREQKGTIILVSSGAAKGGYTGWSAYGASKAAMNSFAKTLGEEEQEITTVSVRPGIVDTPMLDLVRREGEHGMKKEHFQKFVDMKNEGKLLHASAPGKAIAKLALEANHQLSGQFIDWDSVE